MGFTTGIVSGLEMGTPHYYIHSGGNQWDANTYAMFVFDSSGSMDAVISPLTAAMNGPYFSSGSAAGQDGVKSTTSLRAELQDLYATGGIEGAPDWNTDDSTNGKDAYNDHISFQSLGDEDWLNWTNLHYKGGNQTQSWKDLGDANEVSNVVMIMVINESKPHSSVQDTDGYHWTQFGAEAEKDFTMTVTNVVGGSYPSDTYIFDDTQYINPQRANNPSHAQYKVNGVVTDSSNVNNKAFSSYDQYVYSAIDSNGNNVLTGTNVKPTALNTGTHSVTFDTAQNWPNGTVVTLRMKSYGYYTKRSDAFGSGTSDPNMYFMHDPANFPNYRTSVTSARVNFSGTTHNNTGYTANAGFYGIKDTGPNNDNRPSLTIVVVDAGQNGGPYANGQANIGGYVSGQVSIQGPRQFTDNGPGNMTAQQMHTQFGVIEGRDQMHQDRTDTNNYSLNDMNDLLSWNGKQNSLSATVLYRKNYESSTSYWKDQLRAALQQNLSF
tara:strand:+ start:124 stop:1602 length:1479 start_codon:yes stop_codon:yes gene_type:complete